MSKEKNLISMIEMSGKDIIFRFKLLTGIPSALHSIPNETLGDLLLDYLMDKNGSEKSSQASELFQSKTGEKITELQDRMDAYMMKKDLIQRIKDLKSEGIEFAFHTSGDAPSKSDYSKFIILSPEISWEGLEKHVHHAETNRPPFHHLKKIGLIKEI